MDLWDDTAQAFGDPLTGLTGYSDALSFLAVIAHSPQGRNLQPLKLADNLWVYPTNSHTMIGSAWKMFNLGRRIANKAPVHLIQAREPLFNGCIGYLLSRRIRTPLQVCVYGTNPFDPYWKTQSAFHELGAPLARRILRSAAGIQVDGTATARSLMRAGIPETRIAIKPDIPGNLSDFLEATPDPELRRRLSDGGRFKQLFLYVGRVDPQKNLEFLLDVASRLAISHPAARFVVVGDGRHRGKLERETHDRHLSERVLWAGPQPHQQVVKYMATCDAFVLGSIYEGFAKVLMEAAMSGLPIVTTAVSGSDDAVLDRETGWIVPTGDIDGFVQAVTEIIKNPQRAATMGSQGRLHMQAVVARYSDSQLQARIWEQIVSRQTKAS